jgi:FK506-binding protein 2
MPKTVLDKVCDAIALLAEPGGASRQAIAKALSAAHPDTKPALIKKALAQGVQKGKLEQNGQRFALVGVELAPRVEISVDKTVLREGSGSEAAVGDTVDMAYVGRLQQDGSIFDQAASFKFTLGAGDVIKGWDRGIVGMRVGEKARLVVPPTLGYGKRGSGSEIPGDSTLVFEVTLKKIVS